MLQSKSKRGKQKVTHRILKYTTIWLVVIVMVIGLFALLLLFGSLTHSPIVPVYTLSSVNVALLNEAIPTIDKIDSLSHPIIDLYKKRNFQKVIEKAKQNTYEGDVLYIIGECFFRNHDYSNALPYYLEFLKTRSGIKDHVYFKIATCYRGKKQWLESVKYFVLLRKEYPDSLLIEDSIEKEAYSRINLGDYSKLAEDYENLFESQYFGANRNNINIRLLFFSAAGYKKANLYQKALAQYFRVLTFPFTTYTKNALESIQLLRTSQLLDINLSQYLLLAQAYYDNQQKKEAIHWLTQMDVVYKASKSDTPLNDQELLEWHRLSGLVSMDEKQYPKAIYYFQLAQLLSDIDPPIRQELEYYIAWCHLKNEFDEKATALFEKMMDSPNHSFRTQSALRMLEQTFLSGSYPKGQKYALLLATLRETDELWLHFQILRDSKRYDTILAYYEPIAAACKNAYIRARFFYWIGHIHLEQGNHAKGIEFLKKTVETFPVDYYADKALQYLSVQKEMSEGDIQQWIEQINQKMTQGLQSHSFQERLAQEKRNVDWFAIDDVHLKNAFFFFYLHDYTWADKELSRYLNHLQDDRPCVLFDLSCLLRDSGLYHYSIRYAQQWVDYLNNRSETRIIPLEIIPMVYPQYYMNTVSKATKRYDLPERLVFALIHQESRFYDLAYSHAGAYGLMQLMPETASMLAKQVGLKTYDLFNPDTNIALGSRFFYQLLKQYSQDLALAAYNGGPGRVNRWKKKFLGACINDAHFVERIPIQETRDYVIKVLGYYAGYKWYYDSIES